MPFFLACFLAYFPKESVGLRCLYTVAGYSSDKLFSEGKAMRYLYIFILLLIFALGLSFAVENAHSVHFRYYLGGTEIALSLLLVLATSLGVCLGLLASLANFWRIKAELRGVKRRLASSERELESMRPASLAESA